MKSFYVIRLLRSRLCRTPSIVCLAVTLGFMVVLLSASAVTIAAEMPQPQETSPAPGDPGEIQSRGGLLHPIGPYAAPEGEGQQPSSKEVQGRGLTDRLKSRPLDLQRQPQPGGSPPANLCHPVTTMLTQCKCFSQAECQPLTALFPNSCPAGSTNCAFVPMARGSMPPLPPNLCGYQMPLTVTECSCNSTADCALLSPFCPGACPAGSTSCTCRPMRRGR